MIKGVRDIKNLKEKRVLLRTSLNVPIKNGVVADNFRLLKAVKTINFLRKSGAKVIIIGHIGRSGTETLAPVARELKKYLFELRFISSFEELKNSDTPLILYENLRRDPREVENDITFAKKLALLGDVFVQDAFSVCHRKHASIVSIPKFLPSFAGLLLEEEIKILSRAINPKPPSLFVLGGAKFGTKSALIEKELQIFDKVFVSGAIANDFFRGLNYEVGDSLVSSEYPGKNLLENKKLSLPQNIIIKTKKGEAQRKSVYNVKKEESIVDAFMPGTLLKEVSECKYSTVVWNGPFGFYEGGFNEASVEFAESLASATECGAMSIIGGGDTVAVLRSAGLAGRMSFISTGGGAMLRFLQDGTLEGIEAIAGKL